MLTPSILPSMSWNKDKIPYEKKRKNDSNDNDRQNKHQKQQHQPSDNAASDHDTTSYAHTTFGSHVVSARTGQTRSWYEAGNRNAAVKGPHSMLGNYPVRAPSDASYSPQSSSKPLITCTNTTSTAPDMLDDFSIGLQNRLTGQAQQPSIGPSLVPGNPGTNGSDCSMKAIVARHAGPNWTRIKTPISPTEFKQVQPGSMIWEVTAEKTMNSSAHATHKDYFPTPDGLYCLKAAPFVVELIDVNTLSFRFRRMTSHAGRGDRFLTQDQVADHLRVLYRNGTNNHNIHVLTVVYASWCRDPQAGNRISLINLSDIRTIKATQGVSIFGQLDQASTRNFIKQCIGDTLDKQVRTLLNTYQGTPTDYLDDVRQVVGTTIAKAATLFESSSIIAPLGGNVSAFSFPRFADIYENRAINRNIGRSVSRNTLGHKVSPPKVQQHVAHATHLSPGSEVDSAGENITLLSKSNVVDDCHGRFDGNHPSVSKKSDDPAEEQHKNTMLPPPAPIAEAFEIISEAASISHASVDDDDNWTRLYIEDDDTPVRSTMEHTALTLGATAMDDFRLTHRKTYIKTATTEFDLIDARKEYTHYMSTLTGTQSEDHTPMQRKELNRLQKRLFRADREHSAQRKELDLLRKNLIEANKTKLKE